LANIGAPFTCELAAKRGNENKILVIDHIVIITIINSDTNDHDIKIAISIVIILLLLLLIIITIITTPPSS
jgi:hypothetical protein